MTHKGSVNVKTAAILNTIVEHNTAMVNNDIILYCHLYCFHIPCYNERFSSLTSLEDDEVDKVSPKAIALDGFVSLQWKAPFQCKGKHTVLCNTFIWKNTFCGKSSRYNFLNNFVTFSSTQRSCRCF